MGFQQFADNTLIVEYVCFKLLELKPRLLARRACVTCLHGFHMVISAVLLLKICNVPALLFRALLQDPNIIYGCVYIYEDLKLHGVRSVF